MSTQNCAVQVKIELGHRATVKKTPSPEGFTHDWTVYVRGPENCNISYFIEKVVFNLHGSFPNPKRVLTEPPYAVQEQGYAGFELPIDIYFKNKEDPKKIRFKYDLFLKLEDCPPVNHIRCEKLTFQNPTDEFKKKLLKAGGVLVGPSGESMGQMGEFAEIFDTPISLDGTKRPKSSNPIKEKGSKEKSTSSSKLSSKSGALHGASLSNSKDFLNTEERKDKKSPKEPNQLKRSHDSSNSESSLMKKPKRPSSVSSPPEVKVKEKHRSSEKSRHSKERDGSKSSKDPHRDHHKREVDSQEKDSRERDKEKFEKMKREHKEKKDLHKHKSSSSVTNSPNPLTVKSHSAEKKDRHGSKTLAENLKRDNKQSADLKVDSNKAKKSENSHARRENREDKTSSSSKSNSLPVDKKIKEISKSLSKAPDVSKRPIPLTPESAPPKKKPRVEELFSSSSSSSDEESSEDEDEEVVKAIIEDVERKRDMPDSSDSSSSCDSELDENVLNIWSSPAVSKLSPLSQQKVLTKSPSSIKNPSSHRSARSFSPASEKSWSSKYSPTGSTHSHTSTSHKHSSSKQSAKDRDISKHSKESKSQKSSSKSSHSSSSSEKRGKETPSRSEKHTSKKATTPSISNIEKADKHKRSHSKDRSKTEKDQMDKKPKDVKLTDLKMEKNESAIEQENTEWKEKFFKAEIPEENLKNIKNEKVRSFSIESSDQMSLKKEILSDEEECEKKENVAETFNFENGYGDLGTAPNGEDLIELLKLHQKLESMQDSTVIQRVVQEIEKTGLYKISEKTFDFDLCELDSSTVKKIHNFLCSV
ncbi:uncharacterized protein LOC111130564 isoform X2 [Crassostrea virginica]